ncbi:MAG: class I SAM-dependent methyltransferase [Dehalococcoidia bacterium]
MKTGIKIINWQSVVVGLAASIVGGVWVAEVLGEPVWSARWWGIEVLSFLFVALITEWFIHRFASPIGIGDEVPGRTARFTEEVREATWNFCAVSSKWVSLWQSSTFMYYLHVNTVRNLTAYSSRIRAPLERISTDTNERRKFYDEGLKVAAHIGKGIEIPHFFGLRLLVYRDQVYHDPRAKDQIMSLIQAQALGRVYCIPLVLEKLENSLELGQREELKQLSSLLDYRVEDSLPAGSLLDRMRHKISKKEERRLPVPDFLILNNARSSTFRSNVWWYEGSIPKGNAQIVPQAAKAFAVLCSKVQDALWDEFTAETIEAVPVVAQTIQSVEEAFFLLPYFTNWIDWIKQNRSVTADLLGNWLSAEDELLRRIVKPGTRVLDVGCGFGRHARLMVSECGAELVLGVDLSSMMIFEARKLAEEFGPDKVQAHVDDAALLSSCSDGCFDIVVCMTNTLGNMKPEKQGQCLEQMKRVLKPGGEILISVYNDTRRSIQVRTRSYLELGLHITEQEGALVANEGLRSEHFSAARLTGLIEDAHLICKEGPFELDHIGMYAVVGQGTT